ncbi:MAG: F0F1 ATP synthase subunit A [Saprospiraceae bacterium]|nr:F0F1 ATP synthase subunit A [Saprospiraceae bacterium]
MGFRFSLLICLLLGFNWAIAQDDHSGHDHGDQQGEYEQEAHSGHDHEDHHDHEHESYCGHGHHDEFDPGATAFHHISDANVYSIGPFTLPLPCILYAPETGWSVFMSNKFDFHTYGHGNGHKAYNRYVLDGGSIKRVVDESFPSGSVEIDGFIHKAEEVDGEEKNVAYVCYGGEKYKLDAKSTADGGLFGGGITSFYDFSLTKNVVSMILVSIFLIWMFIHIARRYKERQGRAPKGVQSFLEPIFLFIQEEVVKPFLGHRWEQFQPFIMAIFFFILGLNLFGQIPFLGGSNVTGNLGVTAILAIVAFIVTNINGNKHYWEHIFWMPGVPAWVKTILTPVEFLGLFIKPFTLMLRLFANITAGHMVIIIFVSLIFVFGRSGDIPAGAYGAAIGSTLLTLFMMAIELLVAFIQAFVFAILTASYIGAAIEEHH